ncbi:MAG: hypothetical protein QOG64_659, partial [Acidimicrobiaceae bacterium]|nr:hypothetical protein [Acidimicrobiaceae bacterium]
RVSRLRNVSQAYDVLEISQSVVHAVQLLRRS